MSKTITVAAPLCSPARYWQAKTHDRLAEYGATGAGLRVSARRRSKQMKAELAWFLLGLALMYLFYTPVHQFIVRLGG